jgi:hypothetical protein
MPVGGRSIESHSGMMMIIIIIIVVVVVTGFTYAIGHVPIPLILKSV